MLRLIFSTVVALLFTINSWSQTKVFVESKFLEVGYWDYLIEGFRYDKPIYCSVGFVINSNTIVSNDAAGSYYISVKPLDAGNPDVSMFEAFDNENVECTIVMHSIGTKHYLTIVYEDICYRYQVVLKKAVK